MIFVTVGTHHQSFDRLLGALGPLAQLDDLVVQHGNGPGPPEATLAVPFLAVTDVLAYVERARVVVTHAGVGSFLVAHRAGHVPVMVPRLRRCGEHVDDHQVQLVRALEARSQVIAAWDVAQLADAVRAVPPRRHRNGTRFGALHSSVRRALDGQPVLQPVARADADVRAADRAQRFWRAASSPAEAGARLGTKPHDEVAVPAADERA